MTETFPHRGFAPEENDRKRQVLLPLVENRLRWHMNHLRREDAAMPDPLAAQRSAELFLARLGETIPEKQEDISALRARFAAVPEDAQAYLADVARATTEFVATSFDFEEIEGIARRNANYENFHVNRLIEYGVDDDILHLHVPLTFVEHPLELRTLFVSAMREIANRLRTDPALAGIIKITAESWIVPRARRAIQEMGFTVTELSPDGKGGRAEISRDRLLEMYGK